MTTRRTDIEYRQGHDSQSEPPRRTGRITRQTVLLFLAKCLYIWLTIAPILGMAQENTVGSAGDAAQLPDAPLPSDANGSASVSGTVLDSGGAVVSNAIVSLVQSDGRGVRSSRSDANGQFEFMAVPTGSYSLTVEATGFAPSKIQEFTLATQQAYIAPAIYLAVAGVTTSVTVRPTEEIAAEQIRAEEKQRMLGFVPNFYVSYIPDAAPLTSRQKLSLAAHDTLDWSSFVGVSLGAAMQQATNAHAGYGQGAAGYAKRWGALFADGRSSDFLSRYVFASLLHQDPRYFYQGAGTSKSRLYHALSNAFVARSDSGKIMPNYSYLFGDLCAAALSNAYYPSNERGAGLVFSNIAIGIGGRAAQGLFEEFIGKRLTKHIPGPDSSGDPAPNIPTSVPDKSSADDASLVVRSSDINHRPRHLGLRERSHIEVRVDPPRDSEVAAYGRRQ